MTTNNPWRKFSGELPECDDLIEILEEDGVTRCKVGYVGDTGFLVTIIQGSMTGYGRCISFSDPIEWRYDQGGWLYPEEVTGNEDADYWLVTMKDGEQYSVSFKERVDFESFLEAIINDGLLLAIKPMKYTQPPEWMI